MRIALIVPPLRAIKNMRLPTGLITIAACLRQERPSDEIVIIDEFFSNDMLYSAANIALISDSIVKKTLDFKPDVVGFTVTTADFYHVLHLAKKLKSNNKNILTIIGGPQATLAGEQFFNYSNNIDFVFLGEGEWLFAGFLDWLDKKAAPYPECGLWSKEDHAAGRKPMPAIVADLTKLPMPAYDLLDMERYTAPCVRNIRPLLFSSICFFSSRGCPFNCSFCASRPIWGKKVRYYDPKRVVDEIEHVAREYQIDAFYFYDEVFSLNRKHVKSLCEELNTRQLHLPWACETRVDCVDDEICATISGAGCIQVDFGIEAGNDKGWKTLGKNITERQVIEAFSLAKRHGLRTLANYMVNKEHETEKDIEDIGILISKTSPNAGLANIMTPYPGTDIAKKRGGIPVADYEKLNSLNFNEYLDFIEAKWRFADHELPLLVAAQRVNFAFRRSRYFMLRVIIDWFWGWRHLGMILRSRKKKLYFKEIINIMKRKSQRYKSLLIGLLKK